jgi:hypothetical protein
MPLDFIFEGCILLRSLVRLYYSGRQSQQSFLLLLSPSTFSFKENIHLKMARAEACSVFVEGDNNNKNLSCD